MKLYLFTALSRVHQVRFHPEYCARTYWHDMRYYSFACGGGCNSWDAFKKKQPKNRFHHRQQNYKDQHVVTPSGHLNNHYPQSSAVKVICTQPPLWAPQKHKTQAQGGNARTHANSECLRGSIIRSSLSENSQEEEEEKKKGDLQAKNVGEECECVSTC